MKRIFFTCIVCLFFSLICACSSTSSFNNVENGGISLTLSQLDGTYGIKDELDSSSEVFEGVCVSMTITERFYQADMIVRVEKVYRGNILEGDLINVIGTDAACYKEGSRCIYMTTKHASLFSNKPLYYSSSYPIYMNSLGEWVCELEDFNGMSFAEIAAKVEEYVSANSFKGENVVVGEYCTSSDYTEIAAYSDCIALVVPHDVFVEGLDRTCYECTVKKVLKGIISAEAVVVSFKNSMEPGAEYIVMLTENSDESGTVYSLSSSMSLIKANSAEAAELYSAIK